MIRTSRVLKIAAFCLLTPVSCLFASVQGVVLNSTTGDPQAGVTINVVQPGAGGMKALGNTTSTANGTFTVDATPGPGGPALIQAVFNGVTYTTIMPPGSPTTGVRVEVFNSTATPPAGMKTQHLILLEPGVEKLEISEAFLTTNDSKVAYIDPKEGSLRFYLPVGAPTEMNVSINSTGVPIQRPIEKTSQAGLYKISYPMKPGETRVDMHYTMPATAVLVGKVLSSDPPTKLVTPASVTLTGDGLADLGSEPQTGARVYGFTGTSYKVTISGVGAMRAEGGDSAEEDNGAPKCCEEVAPRVYGQMLFGVQLIYWILSLAGLTLLMGGILLFRRGKA